MRALLALVLALGCASAAAQQWASTLKNSPAEVLDEEDNKLFLATMRQALERPADKQPLGWQNPKTGHRGDVLVLKTFPSRGRECKELLVRSEAQGRKAEDSLNFCRIEGEWKLVGDSQL